MTNVIFPKLLPIVRDVVLGPDELVEFELTIATLYEEGKIKGPVHLAKNNENQLIEIFKRVHPDDWVFAAWRNHYHALLHGVDSEVLTDSISSGSSMGTNSVNPRFYASSIVGGIIPIALGAALALKRKISDRKVWCFVGDMTARTGIFHEAHEYAKSFKLPIQWVIEDNGISVHTPTEEAWGSSIVIPDDVVYYKFDLGYPHHGTGKWVNF